MDELQLDLSKQRIVVQHGCVLEIGIHSRYFWVEGLQELRAGFQEESKARGVILSILWMAHLFHPKRFGVEGPLVSAKLARTRKGGHARVSTQSTHQHKSSPSTVWIAFLSVANQNHSLSEHKSWAHWSAHLSPQSSLRLGETPAKSMRDPKKPDSGFKTLENCVGNYDQGFVITSSCRVEMQEMPSSKSPLASRNSLDSDSHC